MGLFDIGGSAPDQKKFGGKTYDKESEHKTRGRAESAASDLGSGLFSDSPESYRIVQHGSKHVLYVRYGSTW